MYIHVFDPVKKKKVVAGELVNGVFTKKVKSHHFMVIEKGYGIAESVIAQLEELGCKEVAIVGSKVNIRKSFEDVLKLPVKHYGRGFQRFIQ